MPGPAFCAASEVSTKMPVPITAPMPSRVSWNGPSDRCRPFFSAVAMMASSDLTRSNSMAISPAQRGHCARAVPLRLGSHQRIDPGVANFVVFQVARGRDLIGGALLDTRLGEVAAAG